ncbi:MAG: URC4/urg3 family protein [Myxococcales bacterium]|nr:URC4/urg3 family protein [Myxococcales bacterium]
MTSDADAIRFLNDPGSIRERAGLLFDRLARGDSEHFEYHPDKLPAVGRLVAQVTRDNYPDLKIPYHARENHFLVGGRDRLSGLFDAAELSPEERARREFDLTVTSVLLDAGAGPEWSYLEPDFGDAEGGERYARSEGLAIASLHWFASGAFSLNPDAPQRADARALQNLTEAQLTEGFQVGPENPLVGVGGRLGLLHALGRAVEAHPELFPEGRVGGLFDVLRAQAEDGKLPAERILAAVLAGLSSIWPGRESIGEVTLGDVWRHPALEHIHPANGLIPFHKLSQWLSYSLVVPLERAGVQVVALERLTGLPEYRNGGLFIDGGVLSLRDPAALKEAHAPGSELIIEWRAATIVLLDQVAQLVREELGVTPEQLPLPCVLEGGTWAAGRRLAQNLRQGLPPLNLASDGTVF